jgi:hypothetical protein
MVLAWAAAAMMGGAPNQILTEPAVPMKALNPNASYQMAECQRIFTPLESHMRDGGGV